MQRNGCLIFSTESWNNMDDKKHPQKYWLELQDAFPQATKGIRKTLLSNLY